MSEIVPGALQAADLHGALGAGTGWWSPPGGALTLEASHEPTQAIELLNVFDEAEVELALLLSQILLGSPFDNVE